MIRMVWGNTFNLQGGGRVRTGRGPAGSNRPAHGREDLVLLVAPRAFANGADVERAIRAASNGHAPVRAGLSDLVLRVDEPLDSTDDVFRQLRWGGQFLFL